MKQVSRFKALSLIVLLATSPGLTAAQQKQQKQTLAQKTKNFFQKHKAKIIAGVAAAAAIGATIGLAYHTDKTMTAVEKGGMQPGGPLFAQAIAAVGLLGPLGMERTISLMKSAIDKGLIIRKHAAALVVPQNASSNPLLWKNQPSIGKALAAYWGVDYDIYVLKAGFKGFKQKLKEGAQKAINEIKGLVK